MPKSRRDPSVRRSDCPIACALDLLGDRWTLLVLRDLFKGESRYGELQAAAERIPTNILADRLDRLEGAGLVAKVQYRANPPRFSYALTPKGRDTKLILASLALWGLRHVRGAAPGGAVIAALSSMDDLPPRHREFPKRPEL